jgi:Na+/phosphate symporter
MVYYYMMQEFGKSNMGITTGEDYPPSVFGIMIVREGGTCLPRLGFAIYMGVLAKRVACRQVLQSDIWYFIMGWTTALFIGYHVVLPIVLLILGKQTPPTFLSAAAILVLPMNLIEIYFWFFFAQTIQEASKFLIPKEAKEEGDGNNGHVV